VSRYVVVGPEREWVDRIMDDGTGPITIEHDVYLVDAPTRHAAKWKAWHRARENDDPWYKDHDHYWTHPLNGVTVQPADDDPGDAWPAAYKILSDEDARRCS
jgi:hypothetical protein